MEVRPSRANKKTRFEHANVHSAKMSFGQHESSLSCTRSFVSEDEQSANDGADECSEVIDARVGDGADERSEVIDARVGDTIENGASLRCD